MALQAPLSLRFFNNFPWGDMDIYGYVQYAFYVSQNFLWQKACHHPGVYSLRWAI